MKKLIEHLRQYQHNDGSGLVHGYERKGTEKLVHSLESEIAELKEQIASKTLAKSSVDVVNINMSKEYNDAVREARDLAMSLHQRHYANEPDAVPLELCDTPAGVISQIDNMVCGLVKGINLLEDNNRKVQIIKALESQLAEARSFEANMIAGVLDEQAPNSAWPKVYEMISKGIRTHAEQIKESAS